jgi:hypothetical protein
LGRWRNVYHPQAELQVLQEGGREMTYLPWIISAFLFMVCLVSFADINKARKALRKAEQERDDLINQRDHLLQRLQSNE